MIMINLYAAKFLFSILDLTLAAQFSHNIIADFMSVYIWKFTLPIFHKHANCRIILAIKSKQNNNISIFQYWVHRLHNMYNWLKSRVCCTFFFRLHTHVKLNKEGFFFTYLSSSQQLPFSMSMKRTSTLFKC